MCREPMFGVFTVPEAERVVCCGIASLVTAALASVKPFHVNIFSAAGLPLSVALLTRLTPLQVQMNLLQQDLVGLGVTP